MRLITLSVVLGIIALFQSCIIGHPGEATYSYQFKNNSGHQISLVMDELGEVLPDSLVIPANSNYEWKNPRQSPGLFPLRVDYEIKVYYDDNVKFIFTGQTGFQLRDPRNTTNYTIEHIKKNIYLATYTFTVADYEQAVLHNEI